MISSGQLSEATSRYDTNPCFLEKLERVEAVRSFISLLENNQSRCFLFNSEDMNFDICNNKMTSLQFMKHTVFSVKVIVGKYLERDSYFCKKNFI